MQFPGNIIPPSRIVNPVALALFNNPALYPLPNAQGTGNLGLTNNYAASTATFLDNNQGDIKADWRPSDADAFSARYSQSGYQDGTASVVLPAQLGSGTDAPTYGAAISWVRTISSNIVNEARIGFTRTVIVNGPSDVAGVLGENGNATLGIAGGQPFAGASNVVFSAGEGFTSIGSTGILTDGKDSKYVFSDNLLFLLGRHTLKVGANGVRYQQNRFYSGNNGGLGSFTYTGDVTGSALSDFLLNLLNSKGRGQADGRIWGHRHWRFGTFLQDDFKVNSSLTLNLGLRWEYTQPVYEVNDLQSNFDLQTGQLLIAGQNGNSRALFNPYYRQFMPRLGFAWTPQAFDNKLVVRGGYSITSFLEGTGANLRLPLNPPFFFESNVTYATNAPGDIRVGFTDLPPFSGQIAGNIRVWDPDLRPQFTQQVNFTLEYLLAQDISLTAGYVSRRATHTVVAHDSNQPLPGTGPVSTWAPINQRRPLYGFLPQVTTTATTESSGNMAYDGLQLSARKRLSAGIDFLASYTFSKTIHDALGFYGAPDTRGEGAYWANAYDREGNRGFAPWDARHNFTIGGNAQVPFGRGRAFGNSVNRAVDFILGGWQVGYVLSARSGFPVTVTGFDRSFQAPRGPARPNRLRALNTEGRSVDSWFGRNNVTLCAPGTDDGICAYQDPVAGTFGNSSIGTERAPRYFNLDMSVSKQFPIGERQRLDFRAEFFNMPNSVSWAPPTQSIQNPATFGQITAQLNSPRNLQFGLKYSF